MMTKYHAMQMFVEAYYGKHLRKALKADRLAVQFNWSCFIDSLCKNGEITLKQYESWTFTWRLNNYG